MTLNVFKMTNMRCLTIKTYFELIYRLLVISTFDRKPISRFWGIPSEIEDI